MIINLLILLRFASVASSRRKEKRGKKMRQTVKGAISHSRGSKADCDSEERTKEERFFTKSLELLRTRNAKEKGCRRTVVAREKHYRKQMDLGNNDGGSTCKNL